jgi:hypothetical protein
MATWADARRIARSLPGAQVAKGGFAFSVESKGKDKGFAWIWKEHVQTGSTPVEPADVMGAVL